MRLGTIGTVAVVLFGLSAGAGAQEALDTKRVEFRVVLAGNTVNNFVAKYVAYAHNESHNTGSASRGLGHLQDTRRCVMAMYSWIQRDVCVTSQATGDDCLMKYTKFLRDGRRGGTRSQNIFAGRLSARTCGDVRADLNANYASLKQTVLSGMDEAIAEDLKELFETFKQQAGVTRVEKK